MKCYSPSKLNFDICHATLHYQTLNYANLHYGTPHYRTLYFETSYASLRCETRNCTKCARQIFPATFGALEIKMADGPIDRTTSLFRQSLITSVIVANWRTAVVIHIPSIPLCIESTGSTVVSSVILSFIMDLFGKKLYPTCTWRKRSFNLNVQWRWRRK